MFLLIPYSQFILPPPLSFLVTIRLFLPWIISFKAVGFCLSVTNKVLKAKLFCLAETEISWSSIILNSINRKINIVEFLPLKRQISLFLNSRRELHSEIISEGRLNYKSISYNRMIYAYHYPDQFITFSIFKNSFQELSTYFIMANIYIYIESAAIQPGHWNGEEGRCLIRCWAIGKRDSIHHPKRCLVA